MGDWMHSVILNYVRKCLLLAAVFVTASSALGEDTVAIENSYSLSQWLRCESVFVPANDNASVDPAKVPPQIDEETGLALARSPKRRGISNFHHDVFQKFADEENIILIVRDSNEAAAEYVGSSEYTSKSRELKYCRSARSGPYRGLVICDPSFFPSVEVWQLEMARLRLLGFSIAGAEEGYLVRDSLGRPIFSDVDMQGVYDVKTGLSRYSYEMREELNTRLGAKLLRHGPLDQYSERKNIGLKFPMTVYRPGKVAVRFKNADEMRRFYDAHGIFWPW